MTGKRIVPLSSLVEEIYGSVKEKDADYEANLKELQRIDKAMRGQSDFALTNGILAENRDRFVHFVKQVVRNPGIKKLIIKQGQNKRLTLDEFITLRDFYIDTEKDQTIKEEFIRNKKINEQLERVITKELAIRTMIFCTFDENSSDIAEDLLNRYEEKLDKIRNELIEECKKNSNLDDQRFYERMIRTFEVYDTHINEKKLKSILEQK